MISSLVPQKLLRGSQSCFGGTGIRLRKVLIVAGVFFLISSSVLMAQDREGNEPFLPTPVRSVSTVPSNGDVNPYGVAFVPRHFPSEGTVNPGDILISNFNNSNNFQGTGTTIMRVPASGAPSVFFQGEAPLGLSTALTILRKGFVLVGNFPSTDGTCPHSSAGSILVINKSGQQVGSIVDPSFVNGPWDSALFDQGSSAKLFVANGLTGTVVRLDLAVGSGGVSVESATQIASGYGFQCDPVTFVDAPTGLVYNPDKDVLYVASTVDNAVFAVHDAADRTRDGGTGRVIYMDATHLHGPLAMAMAPNGHLLVSNNDAINSDPNQPSEIVEFTVEGKFVKQISVDPAPGGSFGLAVASSGDVARFAAVDDNASVLLIWTLQLP
jgi:DNA-binding beta-propeller fold protein YncE